MDRHSDAVLNENGRAVNGASVLILDQNGQPAAIYADRAGATPLSNPVKTDALGRFSFCAADGIYSAQISLGGVVKYTVQDIRLNDPANDLNVLATTAGAGLVGTSSGGTVQGNLNSISSAIAALQAYTIPVATPSTVGGVKVGAGLAVDGSSALSVNYSNLPVAGASVLGGVKVGTGLAIDGAGVLSATGLTPSSVSSVNSVTPVSGNVTLNTDNIAESGSPTNQWFTAARVRSVVLTGLSTATNAVIAATDTVLAALGKLQAQISANTTAIGNKQDTSAKDASGGYAGLTGFALNLKNAAGTILSSLVSSATSTRTWTFPDKDGTVAMTSDIASPSLALIGQAAVSSTVASVDFLNIFSDTYNKYIIEIEGVSPSATDTLYLRVASAGVLDTTSSYQSPTTDGVAGSSSTQIAIGGTSPSSVMGLTATVEILNARSSTRHKAVPVRGKASSNAILSVGAYVSTNVVSGFRLYFASSNITAGTVRIYGVKNT